MKRAILLLALALAGCPDHGPTEPVPPPLDAGEPCATACERYRQLDCPEGKPTAEGHSCEEVCNNAAAHGILAVGLGECTAGASSCEALRRCEDE